MDYLFTINSTLAFQTITGWCLPCKSSRSQEKSAKKHQFGWIEGLIAQNIRLVAFAILCSKIVIDPNPIHIAKVNEKRKKNQQKFPWNGKTVRFFSSEILLLEIKRLIESCTFLLKSFGHPLDAMGLNCICTTCVGKEMGAIFALFALLWSWGFWWDFRFYVVLVTHHSSNFHAE